MRRIIIDLSFVTTNYNTGVAKYTYRFIDYIICNKKEKEFILLVNIVAQKHFANKYPQFEICSIGKMWMDKLGYFKKFAFMFSFKKSVNKLSADMLFCPWSNPINALPTNKCRVVTIHDLQIRIDKGNYKRRDLWLQNFADSNNVSKSKLVLTISNFSKEQILKFFPYAKDKLLNASNSVSMKEIPSMQKICRGYDYILYVGRMDVMKNVKTLVKAFAKVCEYKPDIKLVLISTAWSYYDKEIAPFVIKHNLEENLVKVINCTETELAQWYKGALLFVFPSQREGFGSPPIEAAFMNIPVVTTKCDSLEEVTMGLLNYYEPPTDDTALFNAIKNVIDNPPNNDELKSIKKTYYDNYSIDNFGQRIYNILINLKL